MRRLFIMSLVVLLAGLFLATGCQTGPAEIRIGVITEITGAIPAVGASCKQGATLAAAQINAAGGVSVGGKKYKVELEVRDCDSKPTTAASLVEEMVSKDSVVAIVGPNSTANAVPAADAAEKEQIVLVTPWSTSPKTTLTSSGQPKTYVFRTCVTAAYEGDQLAKFARGTLAATTAAVIYDETADVLKIQADDFKKSFKAGGGNVTAFETFKPTDKDLTAQLTKIKAAAPAVLFVGAYYTNVPSILKQARALGITSVFLGSNGWSSQKIIAQSGDAIEGSYVFNMYSPQMKDPRTQEFVKAYEAKYKATPDDVAALSFDSVNLIKKGLERAGKVDRQALSAAMLDATTLEGATGSMRFTKASRDPVRGAVILKVEGGQFTLSQQLYSKATKEDVVQFVKEAVEFAKKNGKDAALAEFNNPKGLFNRGELYIFAYDFNGNVIAHGGNKAFIGQNLINMKDPNGVMVIQELIKQAKKGSGWLDYMWENPQTGKVEPKVGYVEKVDDNWWLGSGIYTK